MNLTEILGIGGDQPLVDMNDDDEMSARAPGSPTAPVTTAPDNRSSNFLDAILGITREQGRTFGNQLHIALTASATEFVLAMRARCSYPSPEGPPKGEGAGQKDRRVGVCATPRRST